MDRRLLLASGAYIDLSEYLLKSEAETLYAPLDAILNKQDRLISGTNIKTINGASILGSGNITIDEGIIKETDPVFSASPASTITEEDKASWSDKQDTIDDLDAIREGATKGATAVQPSSLAKVATSGSYNDLADKPETTGGVDIYVWNYSETGTVTEEELQRIKECGILRIPISGIEVDAVRGYQPDFMIFASLISGGTVSVVIEFNGVNYTSSMLITETPTEETITEWGFTKNTGTYSKPSGGIPKADLASAVQDSLGKADTALQSYTERYKGTVTGVKMNGSTKSPSNGVVDLGTVITAHQDIRGKQDKLVSGTNIKTINGESILGSGNIEISGGGGSSSGGSGAYSEVNHETSDTTFTLTPNTFHIWDEVPSLTLVLGEPTYGVANEYLFQFISGSTATTLSLPDGIKGAEELVINPNKIYQISILKGLASVLEWDNATVIKDNFISISGNILIFEYPTTSELTIDVYGRTTGMPSTHILTIPSGVSSYTASNLTNIIHITSVTPSSDDKYNYIYSES